MFLKEYLSPTIFIISMEKYLFMDGRPLPECSMVIVVEYCRSYQTVKMFLDNFLSTVLYKLDTATQIVLLSLVGCTTGLISQFVSIMKK